MMQHLTRAVVLVVVTACARCPAQLCTPGWLTEFHAAGPAGTVHTVRTFQLPGDGGPTLYIGGRIDSIEGRVVGNIAKRAGDMWEPLGAGVNNDVRDMVVFDDGSGPALFVTGLFTEAGNAPASRIAKWDGASWSALGDGLSGAGSALAVHDDGTGPALYVTGTFVQAGGAVVNRVARWTGHAWEGLGTGLMGAHGASLVGGSALLSHRGRLYVGGAFSFANGIAANNVAIWSGEAFEPMGPGLLGALDLTIVYDLLASADGGVGVLAGGRFATSGGASVIGVAAWDGAAWTQVGDAIGPPLGVTVQSLQWFDDEGEPLLAAGGILCTSCPEFSNVRILQDGAWEIVGGRITSSVNVLHSTAGELYAAGAFSFAGDVHCGGLAVLEGGVWRGVARGQGMGWSGGDNGVYALTTFDDGSGAGPQIYAGGGFRAAGTTPANFIARWDGAEWHGVGGGLYMIDFSSNQQGVWDMQAFDDGSGPALFACGQFHGAQGRRVNNIAKWNGESWLPLGAGATSTVYELQTYDSGSGPSLYACGYFGVAEGGTRILGRWDGSEWRAVGGPIIGQFTRALAVFDDESGNGAELYVGGRFSSAGGVPARNIAKWNGNQWAPCGPGLGAPDDLVWSLDVIDIGDGPSLYALGWFDGFQATKVRRWNGASWEAVGALAEDAFSLAAFDDGSGVALYCGTYARAESTGQDPRNSLWKLVAGEWQQYAGGVYGDVRSLLTVAPDRPGRNMGNGLWLGGSFRSVSNQTPRGVGIPSSRIARIDGCAACPPDWNGDGAVNSADVFAFLDEFFALDADFDHNARTDSADFFAFIAAYFSGC